MSLKGHIPTNIRSSEDDTDVQLRPGQATSKAAAPQPTATGVQHVGFELALTASAGSPSPAVAGPRAQRGRRRRLPSNPKAMEDRKATAPGEAGEDTVAQRASEQARLRKERREAKIKAGGSARLNKITGMGGRIVGEAESATPTTTATTPTPTASAVAPQLQRSHAAADPDEVDISLPSYAHASAPRHQANAASARISDATLRQLMLGPDGGGSTRATGSGVPDENEALMSLLKQMMDGSSARPGDAPVHGIPIPPGDRPAVARPDVYTSLFRLLHALLGLGLGLYVALLTLFTGTVAERDQAAVAHARHLAADDAGEQHKRVFFWIFATAETLLLSSRFFLDKGRQPPRGLLWTLVGLSPEPFRGYITVGLRYGQILTTVKADILACVFVLGVCAWSKDAVGYPGAGKTGMNSS